MREPCATLFLPLLGSGMAVLLLTSFSCSAVKRKGDLVVSVCQLEKWAFGLPLRAGV